MSKLTKLWNGPSIHERFNYRWSKYRLIRKLQRTYHWIAGLTRKALIVSLALAFIAGTHYGVFKAGESSVEPKIVKAQEIVEKLVEKPLDAPILDKIAKCESGNEQFNDDGTVVTGKVNAADKGKFQINMVYHAEKAHELGYDIFTDEGNRKMAEYLLLTQGTEPWRSSASCWTK